MEDKEVCSEKNFSSFSEIEKHYISNNCWGLLSSIDVKNCDSEYIRSSKKIEEYVVDLCDLIKVNRFRDPIIVNFGEEERVAGYSLVQLIETSLVSGHFVNVTNTSYIDIFSCKIYDPIVALNFTKEFFKGSSARINLTFRY